jgi:hypothetical protein
MELASKQAITLSLLLTLLYLSTSTHTQHVSLSTRIISIAQPASSQPIRLQRRLHTLLR